jgi:hypothetical protein
MSVHLAWVWLSSLLPTTFSDTVRKVVTKYSCFSVLRTTERERTYDKPHPHSTSLPSPSRCSRGATRRTHARAHVKPLLGTVLPVYARSDQDTLGVQRSSAESFENSTYFRPDSSSCDNGVHDRLGFGLGRRQRVGAHGLGGMDAILVLSSRQLGSGVQILYAAPCPQRHRCSKR